MENGRLCVRQGAAFTTRQFGSGFQSGNHLHGIGLHCTAPNLNELHGTDLCLSLSRRSFWGDEEKVPRMSDGPKTGKTILFQLLSHQKLNWRLQRHWNGRTLLYPISLLIGCWKWVQGGNHLYEAVECFSGHRDQIWWIFFFNSTHTKFTFCNKFGPN